MEIDYSPTFRKINYRQIIGWIIGFVAALIVSLLSFLLVGISMQGYSDVPSSFWISSLIPGFIVNALLYLLLRKKFPSFCAGVVAGSVSILLLMFSLRFLL